MRYGYANCPFLFGTLSISRGIENALHLPDQNSISANKLPAMLLTQNLNIRRMQTDDAAFMLKLLNERSWLRFIGDRGVRTLDDARRYIDQGPVAMYARLGFGFYLVERREDGCLVGMCGLSKRDYLDDVDLGFAFLPEFWGQGYAYEAAAAVICHARQDLGLTRIVATTRLDNEPASALLQKLGLRFERIFSHPDGDRDLQLFAMAI